MVWNFVGRAAILERLRITISGRSPGPVIITGAPGAGRSALLTRALAFTDPARDLVVGLRSAEVLAAASGQATDARLVIAVDDAHLADHASMLAARKLSREGKALILATAPIIAGPPTRADPTECLRYEKNVQVLAIPPLSTGEVAAILAGILEKPVALVTAEALHAATDGNPRWLHDLITGMALTRHTVIRDGAARLADEAGIGLVPAKADRARVIMATWAAWGELARERAEQLCLIALCCGIRAEIAPVWATLLLLRGDVPRCLAFLDEFPVEQFTATPALCLTKAAALVFGADRAGDAFAFLAAISGRDGSPPVVAAYRTWLLAATGRLAEASAGLADVQPADLETATFTHATRAVISGAVGQNRQAVFHIRRALASAETCTGACPWVRPLLTASLIDAMLLSGRVQEASSLASGFHARAGSSGWDIALALETLATSAAR
jgi:hypothetical protein